MPPPLLPRMTPHACLNVMLAGRGGQGVILAGHLILESLTQGKLEAKRSEIHGMAQRGSSVIVHLRIGERVHAPMIPRGETHFVLGIDPAEGDRWCEELCKDGALIVLDDAERGTLPHTRFQNIAVFGKFCAALCASSFFTGELKDVLETLKPSSIETILNNRLRPELVSQNMEILERFFQV